jgi:AcrR family transcriptional regulator
VPRPPSPTRRKILDLAERHLMRRGYHAFSYQHIADTLEIKTAAVHYHFRTKPQLVVATIARYGFRFDQWAASVCDLPPAEQLVEYLEIGRLVVARKRVCALAMLTSQLEAVPAEVADITRETQARILAFYVHALDAAREAGAIRFEGSPHDMAVQTACAVTGAQQLAKAMGPQVYDQVCRQLLANLGLPASSLSDAETTPAKQARWLAMTASPQLPTLSHTR